MQLSAVSNRAVRSHLDRTLPNICDADPEALAKYIMALLQRPDHSLSELQESCSKELDEFLGSTTKRFVDDLFDIVRKELTVSDDSHRDYTRKRGHDGAEDDTRGPRRRMPPQQMISPPMHGPMMRAPIDPYMYPPRGMFRPGMPVIPPPPHMRGRGGFSRAPPMMMNGHGGPIPGPPLARRRPREDGGDRGRPTNLFITNIPDEVNTLMSLSAHFGKFGNIVNVQIKKKAKKAYLQFETHEQAKRAISSPDAVCGNRFVRVHWAKYDPADRSQILATPEETEQDTELVRMEKEAEQRRKMFQLEKTIVEQTKMVERLRSMKGENKDRASMIEKIDEDIEAARKELDGMPELPPLPDSSEEEELNRRLAQAEKKAAAMGIVDEGGNFIRGRGRGRGGRGRGGRMALDNRSRTLVVKDIPDKFLNVKMLRSHFQVFGALDDLSISDSSTTVLVTYASRIAAQHALQQGKTMLGSDLTIEWNDTTILPSPKEHFTDLLVSGNQTSPAQFAPSGSFRDEEFDDDEDDEDNDRSWRR